MYTVGSESDAYARNCKSVNTCQALVYQYWQEMQFRQYW